MRRLSVAAALVVLGALAFAGSARACRCAQTAPAEALRRADAAIVAKLVKVVPRGAGQADYRYKVRSVYKGRREIDFGEVISIRSANRSAACGLPHDTDTRYGLLLTEEEGRWFGGLCGLIEPRELRSAASHGVASPSGQSKPGDCTS